MRKTSELKKLLLGKEILVAPGAYDALSAKLIQEAGFKVVYATGAGISNSQFGFADVGLTSQTEILEQVRRIVSAVERPVMVDVDTGYGNVLNLIRTVKEFEKAGAAALQIEDQTFPKKCGHFEGKDVVSREEMVNKIKAAVDTRQDPDLVIIARTDARAVLGLEEAMARAHAYVEAGADAIFVEAPETIEEMQRIGREISIPKVANMVEGGKTPLCDAKELEEMGYRVALFANCVLRTSVKAIQKLLRYLIEHGSTTELLDEMITMQERNRITGLGETYQIEKLYAIK
ncbi:MAG: oxaloacetate decarboxylase [Thermodesulfobacteriota bacterium]